MSSEQRLATEPEKWRKFEILQANFQAIGKWQSRMVDILVLFLCLVWAVELLHNAGGITVQVLGASIQIQGFWQVVPLVCTVLCLGLIGSVNIIHHAWRRLDLYLPEVFSDLSFFYTEFDHHKNMLDYIAFLTLSLRRPVLPDTADDKAVENQRWNVRLLLYPALVFFSIFTTTFTLRRISVTWHSVLYVWAATVLQTIFAFPFLWRKLCLFTGAHKNAYEGVDWGTAALDRMSLPALRKIVERNHQLD